MKWKLISIKILEIVFREYKFLGYFNNNLIDSSAVSEFVSASKENE